MRSYRFCFLALYVLFMCLIAIAHIIVCNLHIYMCKFSYCVLMDIFRDM